MIYSSSSGKDYHFGRNRASLGPVFS